MEGGGHGVHHRCEHEGGRGWPANELVPGCMWHGWQGRLWLSATAAAWAATQCAQRCAAEPR
jgi:hypothetical protein